MNVRELALLLLSDIGCTSLDPTANTNAENARGLVDGDLEQVVAAINGGLQELWGYAPSELTEVESAEQLRLPTPVTFTATQYSKTISAFSAYASWMRGCTVRTPGDQWDNEIVSATQLLRPWQAASGVANAATVYADAVPLDSTIKNVLAPVYLPNIIDMEVLKTREEFLLWGTGTNGPSSRNYSYYWLSKPVGIPQVCAAFNRFDPETVGGITLFLRVKPMPGEAYPITFTAKLDAPTISVADIGNEDSDPDIRIPTRWIESILWPLARKRFIAHPDYDNAVGMPEIERQHQIALAQLQSFAPIIARERTHYGK